MVDLLAPLVFAALGALALSALMSRMEPTRRERSILWLAFGLHVLASFAQVWVQRFKGGDLSGFQRDGMFLAELMRRDPGRFVPEVFRAVFLMEVDLPRSILEGTSTAAIVGISGFANLLAFDSFYGSCVLVGLFGFFGHVAIYLVLRRHLPAEVNGARTRAMVAALLVPSAIFWSAGLIKETVAIGGFGWLVFGFDRWVHKRVWSSLLIAGAAAVVVALVKAYVLAAFAIAGPVYWYWSRAVRAGRARTFRVRPVYLVLAGAAAIAFALLLGRVFPRFAIEHLGQEMNNLQATREVGGSTYSLMPPDMRRSLFGQLLFAPVALITALFRPFFFEIPSVFAAINAVETTITTFLMGRALIRHGPRRVFRFTISQPLLMFAIAFVLTFGVGVGLATTNLGTLSRYRAPMTPLFVLLVLWWDGLKSPRVSVKLKRDRLVRRRA